MIAIRTDANKKLATGHVMRCLTISKELKKRGESVAFFTVEAECKSIIEANSFSAVMLHGVWNNLEEELDEMKGIIIKDNVRLLVVDSYYASPKYLKEINDIVPVLYVDDFFSHKYEVSYLLNYNGFSFLYDYEKRYENEAVVCMLGPSYAPLREEFADAEKKCSDKVKRILLLCGGGDIRNCLGQQLDFFSEQSGFSEYEFVVVAGRLNDNFQELKDKEAVFANVTVLVDINNMASVMAECDMAVSAASTTLYELCAVGVPTIFYETSEDQKMDACFFDTNEIMVHGGSFMDDGKETLKNIWKYIKDFTKDKYMWEMYHERMMKVVDGMGAQRIVNTLLEDIDNEV